MNCFGKSLKKKGESLLKDTTKSAIRAVLACFGVGATGYFAYKAGKSKEEGPKKFVMPVVCGAATCVLMIASNHTCCPLYGWKEL